MDVRRGTVTKFRSSITVSGGENNSGVSTKHHTSFVLDGFTVIFVSAAPPVINDGDQLIVAGTQEGQVLKAYAYHNLSMHVVGNEGTWKRFMEGLGFFLLMCLFFGLSYLFLLGRGANRDTTDLIVGLVAIAVGLVCTVATVYYFYHWLKVREAVKLLQEKY